MHRRNRSTRSALLVAAATVLAPIALARAEPVSYTGTFTPVNNSGVAGTTDLSLDGNTLTVTVNATGLEPNQQHEQHIHGFANGQQSVLPPNPLTPAVDLNSNGILEDAEAEAIVGPPLLGLSGTLAGPNVD